jgi:hypothetical protein
MADKKDTEQPQNETVLVARVIVHLTSGASFELMPFLDHSDVKKKVTDLLEDWAKSGYLVRGSHIYPWHQVKLVEATSVVELSRHESEEHLIEWQKLDLASMQQAFWKTKQPRNKTQENGHEGDEGAHPPPGM